MDKSNWVNRRIAQFIIFGKRGGGCSGEEEGDRETDRKTYTQTDRQAGRWVVNQDRAISLSTKSVFQ